MHVSIEIGARVGLEAEPVGAVAGDPLDGVPNRVLRTVDVMTMGAVLEVGRELQLNGS
jgi:hypothetical protein